jgi:hypothetical protein
MGQAFSRDSPLHCYPLSSSPIRMTTDNSPQSRGLLHVSIRVLLWALIAETLFASFVYGMRLRRWTWDVTEPIRYQQDIFNGCFWGLAASGPEGYLNQYEKMAIEDPPSPRFLDYAPLRLFAVSRWGAWLWKHHPPDPAALRDAWQPEYEYTKPMLLFNAAMDGMAAVCAFFLTWLWVRRGSEPEERTHFTGVWQGVIAALLLWFSPAIVLSAHGWPTWDSWIIPFYLLGALLASLDCWFFAGVVIAMGAMFKGQQFTALPVFLLWPLFQKKWGGAVRFIAGLTIAFAGIASPWLVSYLPADKLAAARRIQAVTYYDNYPPNLFAIQRLLDWPAMIWIGGMILAGIAARPVAARVSQNVAPQWKWASGIAALAIFLAAIWPWFLLRNRHQFLLGVGLSAALAAAAIFLPLRALRYTLALAVGAALLLCIDLFHGSSAWWYCGFHYGTIHYPLLIMGNTSNLPGLFQLRWNWPQAVSETAFVLPPIKHLWPETAVTSKMLFNTLFIVVLIISAVGVALQARRQDRRMLVALVTPWLMFFCLPVQIHERYLLFAAGVSAICIGQSVGMALLGLFLTAVTWIMTIHVMLDWGNRDQFGSDLARQFPRIFSPDAGHTLYSFIQGTHPDIAWAVLVIAAIFMWLSLTPTPGRRGGSPLHEKCGYPLLKNAFAGKWAVSTGFIAAAFLFHQSIPASQ